MSRLLRGRVRRLEERASVGNIGRMIVETLEEARLRAQRAARGERVEPPKPPPSREELEREVAAGGVRRLLAEARLRAGLYRQEATP